MIDRNNFHDTQAFLQYRTEILQRDTQTIRQNGISLKHLLNWADDCPLENAGKRTPSFPAYLLTIQHSGKSLSPASLAKHCFTTRMFFEWAKQEYPQKYKGITAAWLDTIRPRRENGMQSVIHKVVAYPLEDILKIARLKVTTLLDRRDQAAMCFLYLSGMRITAFVNLPLRCVDIPGRAISQLPELGVITKNRKAAITTLLPIPKLLQVVQEWDELVRQALPDTCHWYSRLTLAGELDQADSKRVKPCSRSSIYQGIHRLCALAGIPYRSPHKLRHGHAFYGLSHAQDMKQYKAISQNLMHKSIAITDGIYANLTSDEVRTTIANLGSSSPTPAPADMAPILQALLKLQNRPDLLQEILNG